MRKTLLVSVAAAALAVTSFANAQAPSHGGPSGAPAADTQATPDHGPGHPGAAKGAREPQKSVQQGPANDKGPGTAQTEPRDQKMQPRSTQSDTKPQPDTKQQRNTQTETRQPGATPNNAQGTTNTQTNTTQTNTRQMTTSNVSLTTQQKTVIREKVLTSSAPRVTNVNFDIRVGTVVPRTVRIVPVPVEIVEIQPTWRGYMYFVSGDEIIVVEPGTLRIVAVLDV